MTIRVRFRPRARTLLPALLALVVLPAAALAHQFLRASAPARGETLEAVPAEIRLTFSEAVRLEFTELTVRGPEGALTLAPLRVSADDPRVLEAAVEGGWHAGDFTLRWVTVGADGHRTDGTVPFSVAEGAAGLPEPEPEPEPGDDDPEDDHAAVHHDPALFPETPEFGPASPAYVVIRGLIFVSLIALLGAVALRLVVLPVAAQRRREEMAWLRTGVDEGARRLGLAAGAALLVGAVARLWAQSASLFGPDDALDPERLAAVLTFQPWATGWWIQAGAAALAITGLAVAGRASRPGWVLAGLGAIAAAVTPALSGHAVASPGTVWLAVPADAIHVLSAGGWIGALLATMVVGIPVAMRLDGERRGRAVAALVRGFSLTALFFAGLLMATGLLASWIHVGEIGAFGTSSYGRTLLLKLAIFAGVFVTGAYNFLRVRPALGDDVGTARLRRSAAVELALALAVVAVTAVLVAIPPPAD